MKKILVVVLNLYVTSSFACLVGFEDEEQEEVFEPGYDVVLENMMRYGEEFASVVKTYLRGLKQALWPMVPPVFNAAPEMGGRPKR